MPVFSLKLQADSENIETISTESVGRWCVVLSQGGEESGEVYIVEGAENEVPGGKGVANFVMKFKVRINVCACCDDGGASALSVSLCTRARVRSPCLFFSLFYFFHSLMLF